VIAGHAGVRMADARHALIAHEKAGPPRASRRARRPRHLEARRRAALPSDEALPGGTS